MTANEPFAGYLRSFESTTVTDDVWVVTSGDGPDEEEHLLVGAYSSLDRALAAANNPDLGRGWCRSIQQLAINESVNGGAGHFRLTIPSMLG